MRRTVSQVAFAGRAILPGLLLALFLPLLLAASASAADDESVRTTVLEDGPDRTVVRFQFGDYASRPVRIDGRPYTEIRLAGEGMKKERGAPETPLTARSIIVPDDAEMAVRVLNSEFEELRGIDVTPSKGILYRTVDPADVPYTFGKAYERDAFYPGELAELAQPYIMRDHRGIAVTVNPFQYNPVQRVLRVYREITVEVSAIGPGLLNVLDRKGRPRALSRAFHDLYRARFLNYNLDGRYGPLDEVGDLLVIVHDPWLSNVMPLADYKNSVSINTTVVAVSAIGNNATAIKNYIQSVYDTSDLAFVLLVGDSAEVATPYASGGASDPSYSKLAGSDDYPDIMVGRFSAQTAAHVDTQVQRTIEYETMSATTQDWFWRGMGIASNQGPGDDGEYDNQHVDNIRDELLAHGYTEVDQIYDPSGTASMVSSGLNAGRGIINYCGHGSTTSWGTTGFSNSNIDALVNDNMLPFIISVACVNGQFDGPTCFGEAWLRATHNGEPTGAIGAYMSSINQSWSPPMEGQDEFNHVYCDLSEPCRSYGTLCYAGSCSMMDVYGSAGVEMFNTWHVFGDPSLVVIGTAGPGGPPCPADLSDDGVVDPTDLAILLGAWDTPNGDLNGDGTTGPADLAILLANWGPCP